MEESVKLYDRDSYNKLIQGIKVIQSSDIDNTGEEICKYKKNLIISAKFSRYVANL